MEQDSKSAAPEDGAIISEVLAEASLPFIGRWNRLVSSTNWEKGRIIFQWRDALMASGVPSTEYSDEAWSRRVGGVTGQHAGRLRRVYQRFGQTYEQYEGLYWSHFQAAIDWDDAEMWLEGAVQNNWSVSQLRRKRWETMGALEADQPKDDGIVTGELDEDFEPALNEPPQRTVVGEVDEGPRDEGPDFGDEQSDVAPTLDVDDDGYHSDDDAEVGADAQLVRPFQQLGDLPEDLGEAIEAFKLAILRHKMEGWREISRDQLVASLEALKQLALAPSDEKTPASLPR